jgi:N utilization substance protein B
MVEEVETIYEDYLKMLLLLVEITDIAVWDQQRRLVESEHQTARMGNNVVIKALRNLPAFELELIRHGIKWTDDDLNTIKKLFIEAILVDETFQAYLHASEHTFEEDLAIVVYILKTYVLKHHLVVAYFEEKGLNWQENKEVLKSLTTKTFKIATPEELALQPLAMNWEEDKGYFIDLFDNALNNDATYEGMVMEQTKNWEADRLAMTDMLILKLGLAELINFSSIPTKVTINEFIEIAKNYSTPKSGQFVNGLLDVLSQKLTKDGVIRKSGRGLIDNK